MDHIDVLFDLGNVVHDRSQGFLLDGGGAVVFRKGGEGKADQLISFRCQGGIVVAGGHHPGIRIGINPHLSSLIGEDLLGKAEPYRHGVDSLYGGQVSGIGGGQIGDKTGQVGRKSGVDHCPAVIAVLRGYHPRNAFAAFDLLHRFIGLDLHRFLGK